MAYKRHGVSIVLRADDTDKDGNTWMPFTVDYHSDQQDGECCICGATISEGYMCLDGGDEVCKDHVRESVLNNRL